MSPHRRLAAAVAVAMVVGMAACSAAVPAPSPTIGPSASEATEATRSPVAGSPAADPSVTPSREPAGDLGRETTVGSMPLEWTSHMLEFASDGQSVLFSSGALDGSDGEHAPDLWRYDPSTDAPELLWQNPRRDRSLVKIGGEFNTWAFVSMPLAGEVTWDFWLLPEVGAEAILLDSHPGDASGPDFVPSFHVHLDQVAWTSFDFGPDGQSLSQLYYAQAPAWEPMLIAERDARRAELWLPSLRASEIAFCEVVYSEDRTTDERHVYVVNAARPEVAPRRLDSSGRATMPILLMNGGVVWKEADPGFNMFNWGRLFHYDEDTGEVTTLPIRPQEYVNYPSAGARFVTAWGADSRAFGVYDLDLRTARLIDRWPGTDNVAILRPHNSWDFLVWLHAPSVGPGPGQIRFAILPAAGSDRPRE